MKSDKELLELAAKAMKYEYKWDVLRGSDRQFFRVLSGGSWPEWNPLHNPKDLEDLIDFLKISLVWNNIRNIWHGGLSNNEAIPSVEYVAVGGDRGKVALLVASELGKDMQ